MRQNPTNNLIAAPQKKMHSIVTDKIKSMEDVRAIFDAIGIGFGTNHPKFNKIKHLLTKEATH